MATAENDKDAVAKWKAAVAVAHAADETADEPLMAETLAMSADEIAAEFARDGVDVAALHAEADAAFDAWRAGAGKAGAREAGGASVEESAWVAKVEPPAPPAAGPGGAPGRGKGLRRANAVAYAAVAAAAAATVGVATYLGTRPAPTPAEDAGVKVPDAGKEQGSADAAASVAAREMRAQAMAACASADFAPCLAGLDAARELDPAGDEAAEVQAARRRAMAGLAAVGADGKKGPGRGGGGKGEEKGGK